MRVLAIILALSLSACTTMVPVTAKFPAPPGTVAQTPCAPLQRLTADAKLSDVAKTIADNYTEYYVCAARVETWQEWYEKQKAIYESIK